MLAKEYVEQNNKINSNKIFLRACPKNFFFYSLKIFDHQNYDKYCSCELYDI